MTGKIVSFSAWVPLEAADLQGEPVPVDQQPHHDLRVDPPLLRVADLAQAVFLLGLEVQRRYVIQDERDIAAGSRVREAQPGDRVAVAAFCAPGQGASHGLVTGRPAAQACQDPAGVQDRGRLHDPGQDQVPEHLITQGAELQGGEDAVQGTEQHPRVGRHHPQRSNGRQGRTRAFRFEQRRAGRRRYEPDLRRSGLDAQVERALGGIRQHLPRPLKQDPPSPLTNQASPGTWGSVGPGSGPFSGGCDGRLYLGELFGGAELDEFGALFGFWRVAGWHVEGIAGLEGLLAIGVADDYPALEHVAPVRARAVTAGEGGQHGAEVVGLGDGDEIDGVPVELA
jgi:hypothetical protein